METTVPETYHTQDEETRAYREHLLSLEAIEAAQRPVVDDNNQREPIFSD